MHARLATVAAACAALCVSALTFSPPALAVDRPPNPTLSMPSVVGMPSYECYALRDLVTANMRRNQKLNGSSVTIRKAGVTLPLGGSEICGYMGSGRYTLDYLLRWQYRYKKLVTVPRLAPNPALSRVDGSLAYPITWTCTRGYEPVTRPNGAEGKFFICATTTPRVEAVYFVDFAAYAKNVTQIGLPASAKMYLAHRVPFASDDQYETDLYVEADPGVPVPESFTTTGFVTVDDLFDYLGVGIPERVKVGTEQKLKWVWSREIVTRATKSFTLSVR